MIDEKQLFIQINKKNIKTCAFTGHRDINVENLKTKIRESIISLIKKGVETFYNGMAVGFDLLTAETVLSLRQLYPKIKLIACVPFYNQEKNYNKKDKERYLNVLKQADEKIIISDEYYRGCMQVRNKYMADKADVLICYCKKTTGGTAFTVKYFTKKYPEKEIIFL